MPSAIFACRRCLDERRRLTPSFERRDPGHRLGRQCIETLAFRAHPIQRDRRDPQGLPGEGQIAAPGRCSGEERHASWSFFGQTVVNTYFVIQSMVSFVSVVGVTMLPILLE